MAKDNTANIHTEQIIEMYINGKSSGEIGKIFNISSVSVRNVLKRNNISRRCFSEAGQKYKINQDYFDEIKAPNKAYILGFLCADGCNHRPKNMVKTTLKEDDIEVLEFIKKELECEHPIKTHKNSNSSSLAVTLSIQNKKISERLEELGCVQNKSLILEFPDWLENNLIPHFIRGYFDGDGYIQDPEKRSNCTMITITSSMIFVKGLKAYLEDELDLESHIRQTKNPKVGSLYITKTSEVKKLGGYMYKEMDFCLERKYNKFLKKFYPEKIN